MVPAWVMLFLLIFVAQRTVNRPEGAALLLAFWFGFGVVTDLFAEATAEGRLREGIRNLIAEPKAIYPALAVQPFPAALKPVRA